MIETIITGAIVGFLAGHIVRGEGYGALGNIILGIFGGQFRLWRDRPRPHRLARRCHRGCRGRLDPGVRLWRNPLPPAPQKALAQTLRPVYIRLDAVPDKRVRHALVQHKAGCKL